MKKYINNSKWLSNKYAVLIIALLAVGFLLFNIAYIGMQSSSGIGSFNETILYWVTTHRDPIIDTIMKIATTTASPTFFVITVSISSFIWAYKKHEIWRPFIMSVAVVLSALTSTILKIIIQNERPITTDMVPPFELGYSFPSGHTLSTIVFLLVTGYLFYSRYLAKDRNFWLLTWIITTISGTAIIAISRIYLGYHWLTDITASIGLGLIIFALIIITDKYYIGNHKRTKVII